MSDAGAMTAPVLDRATAGRLMRRATAAAIAASAIMIVIKFAAYMATDSVSVLSSLFDSSLDFAASMVNLIAVRTSSAMAPAPSWVIRSRWRR